MQETSKGVGCMNQSCTIRYVWMDATAWNRRAVAPSPVVISEMETPTPEMDAFERDIIACIPEELHQLQAYARKGRELETRLAAAEAELAAMRSGEGGKPLDVHEPVGTLSTAIVSAIFDHASDAPMRPHRMEYKIDPHPKQEKGWGGLNEWAMRNIVERVLKATILSAPAPDAVVEVTPPMKEGE